MSDYNVDVGLNLDAGGYIAGMGQAINLTKQYSDVAGGISGAVANMNKSLVGATMSVTGFNKVNSIAVDTAAAYQKQLAGIETKADLAGTSFNKLAKTTKGFARDFPIGMGQAVAVTQSLQMQGIKSEKQMDSLGKSFIRLGAATGTSAAGIGTEFLQLSKTMGNGVSQFEKLSDSLVTTTAKIGGSAPAVVSFAKALAPVASTVGISQTAVIGLSSAMSKLGEDGYQAANSFNKVLLDMNRAVRDGGPELKTYAEMMGTTSEKLRDLFKTNPSEVLAQFSEAVAKAGPDITRQLDALGFDSVRTTRSLTALARSGGPRQAIDTAMNAYGDGSTDKAAEVAYSGLIDQTEKLKETMGQVVQDVGQPMLGLAKGLLAPANAVASGVQGVTGSGVGQAVLGAGGVASTGLGILGNVTMAATLASLGKMGIDAFKKSTFFTEFSAGRAEAKMGLEKPSADGMSRGLGFGRQAAMMSLAGAGANGMSGEKGVIGSLGRFANRAAGLAMEIGGRYSYSSANMVSNLPGVSDRTSGVTPEMAALRGDAKTAANDMKNAAKSFDFRGIREGAGSLASTAAAYARTADVGALSGAKSLAAGFALNATRSTIGLAGIGAKGLATGLSALPISPATLGVGGAIAGGMFMASKQGEQDAAKQKLSDSRGDVYSFFNSFAEATGKAGKGVVSLAASVEATTQTLVQGNKSWKDAFALSEGEMNQAMSASYTPGIEFTGDDKSGKALATQAKAFLGPTTDSTQFSRALMDVAHATNGNLTAITDFTIEMKKSYGPDAKGQMANISPQSLTSALDSQKNWTGLGNETQGTLTQQAQASVGMEGSQAAGVYGGSLSYGDGGSLGADRVTSLLRAREYYNEASKKPMSASASANTQQLIGNLLGMSDKEQQAQGLGTGYFDQRVFTEDKTFLSQKVGSQKAQSFEDFLNQEGNENLKEQYAAIDKSGSKVDKNGVIVYGDKLMSQRTEAQSATESYMALAGMRGDQYKNAVPTAFDDTTKAASGLGAAMDGLTKMIFSTENSARENQTLPANLTQAQVEKSGGSWAMVDFQNNTADPEKQQKAVQAMLDEAIKKSGGNYGDAKQALAIAAANTTETSASGIAVRGAQEQLGARQGIDQAGRSQWAQLADMIRVGKQAEAMPVNSSTSEYRTSAIIQGQQATAQTFNGMADMNKAFGGMQLGIMQAQRSAGIAAGTVARQSQLSQERATESFNLNKTYAREDYTLARNNANRDFGRTTARATRDFERGQQYQQEDFGIARSRAIRDFNKQELRAIEDHDRQKAYATDDYNKGRLRATRDYDLQISRATRDFDKGQMRALEDFNRNQLRATEDFNKSRTRMIEDYNKQMSRMVEDAAKTMYDPFKRIQVSMVMDAGQLITNLKDQTAAIDKQVQNLANARGMGLSEAAIKQLNLTDAANAQQLSRLVGDLRGNSDLAGQINTATQQKAASAGTLATDTGNTSYARATEDFNTQLARSAEDFNTAAARAGEDFNVSSARALTDFTQSMADAKKDFTTSMADTALDFSTQMGRSDGEFLRSLRLSRDDFNQSLVDMDADYEKARLRGIDQFRTQMGDMALDHATAMSDMFAAYEKQQDRAAAAFKKSIRHMKEDAQIAIAQIGAQSAVAVLAMKESFAQMFQSSPDGVEAAKQFVKNIDSLGAGIKSKMGEDIKALYDTAKQSIKDADKTNFGSDSRNAPGSNTGYTAGATYAPKLPPMSVPDWRPDAEGVKSDWKSVGSNIVAGVWEGIKTAAAGVWSAFTGQGLADVKAAWGIHSPSTVFAEIGKNLVEGLINGITGLAKDAWNALIDPIPTATEIGTAVSGAFNTAKVWLGNLGGTITTWISNGWDSLWTKLSSFDIGAKVSGAFGTVQTYLGNLAINLGTWIGKGWDALVDLMPKPSTLVTAIKNVFEGEDGEGGVKGWLLNIPKWLGTIFGGIKESIANVFVSGFANPIIKVIDWVIEKFNGIQIPEISIGFDVKKPGSWNPLSPDFYKFTDQRVDIIKTPKIDLPNIGFGKGNNESLSSQLPTSWLADGGVVTRQTQAIIGEAGYPEAVIPLNQRGAEVLAATMARYVGNADVSGSRMEAHATPTYNYYSTTQDYSTNFTGEVTVQAQDPNAMAQQLAARAARQRLAQPVGGRR